MLGDIIRLTFIELWNGFSQEQQDILGLSDRVEYDRLAVDEAQRLPYIVDSINLGVDLNYFKTDFSAGQ